MKGNPCEHRQDRLMLEFSVLSAFYQRPGANANLGEIARNWLANNIESEVRDALDRLHNCGALARYGPEDDLIYYAYDANLIRVALNLFTNWIS